MCPEIAFMDKFEHAPGSARSSSSLSTPREDSILVIAGHLRATASAVKFCGLVDKFVLATVVGRACGRPRI